MHELIAPKTNPLVTTCARLMLPLFLRAEKLNVVPTPQCVNAIRKLHGMPTVLMINHSDRYDPVSAFTLAQECGENFWYLAARELFDRKVYGWCMQNCGAYSVIRGSADDAGSRDLTISLMAEGKRKLVEFPEGDVSGRDNDIAPLKRDGLRNVLHAQERLAATGQKLHVLPIGIFYELHNDGAEALHRCLDKLDRELEVPKTIGSIHSRVFTLFDVVLDRMHNEYALRRVPSRTVAQQLTSISRNIILKIANDYDIQINAGHPEEVMLYDLRGELRKRSDAKSVTPHLNRITRLLITASTLQQPVTREIEWRLVDRLEEEITGKFTVKGTRTAWIECGSPVDVSPILAENGGPTEGAITALEAIIRPAMLHALTSMRECRSASRGVSSALAR